MCGIIGYLGYKDTVPLLIQCLKRLEYRGYDSSGLCVLNDGSLKTVKEKGKISELEKNESLNDIKGKIGIAHTRWATHGEPSAINAHPHMDKDDEIAIVHNGIVENYNALKELLDEEHFKSETDSEIIVHLIKKFYKGNLEEATREALNLIEGTFGIVVIHKSENLIIAARKGSPLILGIGDGEMFIASDVPAILDKTRKIVYLEDNELAIVRKDSFHVKHLNGEKIDKKIHHIKWSLEEIEKGHYKHFMLKEIYEQPESLKNNLRGRIRNEKIHLSLDVDVKEIKRIIITACGTSWHSALIGKYIIENLTEIPVEVDYASEFRYRNPLIRKDDLFVAISQSGETADTLAAIRESIRKGAKTIGIVNVVGSTIAREVDSGIYLHCGPEIGVASTKAFTSQVSSLILLALYINQERGKENDDDLIKEMKNLPGLIKETLEYSNEVKEIADYYTDCKNFLYLGRGVNFPVALEGALKLKEISYIHAEGYPAAEIKHGPIALIDDNMPTVFIALNDDLFNKVVNNMREVKARGGKIIALVNEKDNEVYDIADHIMYVPKTKKELSPILTAIPLQLFAYHIANNRNIDVDKPRNLAKSVTVE